MFKVNIVARASRSFFTATLLSAALCFLPSQCAKAQPAGKMGGGGAKAQTTGNPPTADNGGNQGNSSQSQSISGGAPPSYIEVDMLAYAAADYIAAKISRDIAGTKVVVFDQPTFAVLETYEAFSAAVTVFDVAYRQLPASGGFDLKDFGGSATAAQTIASILTTLKSSTDLKPQSVDFNADAIVAQIAKRLP